MPAKEERIHITHRHTQLQGDEGAVPRRIQHACHTHYTFGGKPAGRMHYGCHGVERVRDDNNDSVGTTRHELLGNRPDDIGVQLQQVVARHIGRAGPSRRDHANVRSGCVFIGIGPGDAGVETVHGCGFLHVERFSLRQALDDVDENDFVHYIFSGDAIGNSGSDVAGSDDSEFGHGFYSAG